MRCRQKYTDEMVKDYEKRVYVPPEISPGEFVYMHCPYLSTKYHGITRLNIQARGPFVVLEVIDNRLCRLARVSDLRELPRMVAISRLKATNLGLDPPRFPYDEHLTAEQHEEWILRGIDVQQPWDAELSAPDVENRGNGVTQGDNAENRSGNVDRQEIAESNDEAERENNEPHHANETEYENDGDTPVKSDLSNKHDIIPKGGNGVESQINPEAPVENSGRAMVRMSPKIRTTRAGPRQTELCYKEIVRIMRTKVGKDKITWYEVLCQGDHPARAFWVERHSMKGNGVDKLIKDCLSR